MLVFVLLQTKERITVQKTLEKSLTYEEYTRAMMYADRVTITHTANSRASALRWAFKQALKTQEEVLELLNAIVDNDKMEIEDAIGDILVTLIILAEMQEVTLEECLNGAYDIISKRTGKMINGQFVKNE